MYLSSGTLDDLLKRVFEKLLVTRNIVESTRGKAAEISGVLLRLHNPRARLSHTETKGKIFSCIGELLWYLAGTNQLKFIKYYLPIYADDSDDGKTIYGAYGPRLFGTQGINQVENVIRLLNKKRDSRRAVIQLFEARDIAGKRRIEIPCTCSMQFIVRRGSLHMMTHMRSNDAYFGLPHDIFAFTMLQEILAVTLGVKLGTYKHFVGSLHLYESKRGEALKYVEEGWQPTKGVAMADMPRADPWNSIRKLLKIEHSIRMGRDIKIDGENLHPYWKDLARLLQIFRYSKDKKFSKIKTLKREMASPVYDAYISNKQFPRIEQPPSSQLDLPYPIADGQSDR